MKRLEASHASGDMQLGNSEIHAYAARIAARHVAVSQDAGIWRSASRRLPQALALSASLVTGAAQAATITVAANAVKAVNGDGACSLIEAIRSANTDAAVDVCAAGSAADTIILPSGSVFTINDDSFAIAGMPYSHYGDTGLPGISTELTIEGNGSTLQRAGGGAVSFRLLHVEATGNLTLNDLTLQGGYVPGGTAGGGIQNYGTLELNDSTLSNNTAYTQAGGISNTGTLTLNDSTLSGNMSGNTGGGIINSGALMLNRSTLSGNTALADGGGIFNSGTLTINHSTLSVNSANVGDGGGIFNSGTATLSHSTLSGNTAGGGGGILNGATGTLTLNHSTLSGNTGGNGGGGILSNGDVTFANSLVVNSPAGNECLLVGGTSNVTGTNFATDSTCNGFTEAATAGSLLGPLAFNGGPTQTHALITGHPAIDAATGGICDGSTTDQRGISRPQDGGGGSLCDVGAYELIGAAILDLGDAPTAAQSGLAADYPVTLANQGVAHRVGGVGSPFLGLTAPDAEADGQPSAGASDDGAEEDGFSPTSFTAGTTTPVTVTVTLNGAVTAFGNAWIDLNRDGDWDDAGEQLADDIDALPGSYTINVTLPSSAPAGTYFARARICSTTDTCNTPKGGNIAPDGEVEDYAITVNAQAQSGGGGDDGVNILGLFRIGAFDPITLALMAMLGALGWKRRRR